MSEFAFREPNFDVVQFIGSDDALFHYTKLSIAVEEILFTKKIKLSFLKNTNDPKEYKFLDTIPGEWNSNLWTNGNIVLLNNATQCLDKIYRSEFRILCFCSNKKPTLVQADATEIMDTYAYSKGWFKPRMWAQYGEGNHGICLVFSKKALVEELQRKGTTVKSFNSAYVKYTQTEGIPMETITIECDEVVKNGPEKYAVDHIMRNLQELFFRKHVDFRDEAEYRIVVHDPQNNLDYIDIDSSIKAVITGDRTPKVYDPLISTLCTEFNIELKHIHWINGNIML